MRRTATPIFAALVGLGACSQGTNNQPQSNLEEANEAALSRLDQVRSDMRPDAALWIVYPKGRKDIPESAVMRATKLGRRTCAGSTSAARQIRVVPA